MIPATVLIPIIGSAIKLLAAGRASDSGEWVGVVSGILAALVAERDETNAALERIEAKLDRLALQDFQHSYGAALNLLEEAMPEGREPAERERLIAEARNRLSDALAAAPDPLGKAVIQWYIGIAWLLSRSGPDCERVMARAAADGLAALREVAEEWSPSIHSDDFQERIQGLESGSERLGRWFTSGLGPQRRAADARGLVRRELQPRVREAETVFRAIQRTRAALGVPSGSCRPIRLSPPVGGDPSRTFIDVSGATPDGDLQLIVDLDDASSALLDGVEVGVPAIELLPGAPMERWSLFDAEVSLRVEAGNEPLRFTLCVLGKQASTASGGPYRSPQDPTGAGAAGRVFLASTAAAGPPLSGPPLMASGAAYPPQGEVSVQPGQPGRGWVRFATEGAPAAILVTPWPGQPLHFIRSLGWSPPPFEPIQLLV